MRTSQFYRTLLLSLILVTLVLLSACTKEDWSRGQPPDVKTLFTRASTDLDLALQNYSGPRADIAPIAKDIKSSLSAAVSENETTKRTDDLKKTIDSFIALEENLSIGSRAAYGELSGQLRVLETSSERSDPLKEGALGLFAARAFFFLANELSVPKPVS